MTVVLGIDAAWTATEPSGVALVASDSGGWRCIAVAPNYDAFLALPSGASVDWRRSRFCGSAVEVPHLLDAARSLAGDTVDLVAIDMPVATVPITGRRTADNVISSSFGGRGCSTHTPSADRPGSLGCSLSAAFAAAGFSIATSSTKAGESHRLLEVYPHPALLALLGRPYRVPYKVTKVRRYFPSSSAEQRVASLLAEFHAIRGALEVSFGRVELPLPEPAHVKSPRLLKPYEDTLDALVCAWVAVCYAQESALAFGDETAAIWCPEDVMRLPALGRGV